MPEYSFGSSTVPFSTKKAARSNAAQEAVQRLIAEGKLKSDGSTLGNKKAKASTAPRLSETAVRIEGTGLEVKKGTSYAQKVEGGFLKSTHHRVTKYIVT